MTTNTKRCLSYLKAKRSDVLGFLATFLFFSVIAFAIITMAHFVTFKFKHPGESFFTNFTRSSVQYPLENTIRDLDKLSSRYGFSLEYAQSLDTALPVKNYLDCYYNNDDSGCLGIKMSNNQYQELNNLKKHIKLLDETEIKKIVDTFPKASMDFSYVYVPFENLTPQEIDYYQKHSYDGMIKENFLLRDNSGQIGKAASLEFCLANPFACHYIYQYRPEYRRY